METSKIFYGSADGESSVHACVWKPVGDAEVKGIIQIVHNTSEHILRYVDFARVMVSQGYIVCGNDHLGHGGSAGGRFGHIEHGGHKALAKDVHKLTTLMKREFDMPVVLLGVGTGSLIARYVCAVWDMDYVAAAFSGTSGGSKGLSFLHRLFSNRKYMKKKQSNKEATWIGNQLEMRLGKNFKHSDHGPSWRTRDVYQVAAFENDPLCGFAMTHSGYINILRLNSLVNSKSWLMRMSLGKPIFLFSGLNDPVGDFGKGVVKVYGDLMDAGYEKVQITLYQNARHEMLFELNRQEVYQDIIKWVDGILG